MFQTQPKNSIVLTIRDFRIHISFGDLFAKKGIVVIPVNEYFDTIVDDHIIAHKTIHGQFIDKYFANDIAALDSMIDRELQGKPTEVPRYHRNHAKVTPYPVGTCIDIVHNGVTYVLFALTKFNEKDVAYLEKKYFGDAIRGLMSHLHSMNNDRPVYMPVICRMKYGKTFSMIASCVRGELMLHVMCLEVLTLSCLDDAVFSE